MNLRDNRFYLQLLRGFVVFIGLILILWIGFRVPQDSVDAQKNASSTKTAIAMTAQALLGPFPTSTAPSATASDTPSPTWTATLTATIIPSRTPTPFPTVTQQTKGAHPQTNSQAPTDTLSAPTIRPANTPGQPTNPVPTSPFEPTNPPQQTSPPPTSGPPPAQPTSCLDVLGQPILCN